MSENAFVAGEPAWKSYLDDVDTVITAIKQFEKSFVFVDAVPSFPRRNQLTKRVATSASGVPNLIVALESTDRDGGHAEFDDLVSTGFRLILCPDQEQ